MSPRLPPLSGLPIRCRRPVPSGTWPEPATPGVVATCWLETDVTGVSVTLVNVGMLAVGKANERELAAHVVEQCVGGVRTKAQRAARP